MGAPATGRCTACGDPDLYAKGYCKTDYQYVLRYHRERTWEQIARANARAIDRELARRVVRMN